MSLQTSPENKITCALTTQYHFYSLIFSCHPKQQDPSKCADCCKAVRACCIECTTADTFCPCHWGNHPSPEKVGWQEWWFSGKAVRRWVVDQSRWGEGHNGGGWLQTEEDLPWIAYTRSYSLQQKSFDNLSVLGLELTNLLVQGRLCPPLYISGLLWG